MDGVNPLLLVSRWIHISTAIVAIGGFVFVRFVLFPAAAQSLDADQDERLREAVRRRWARFVHVCIALLLLTGSINFAILAIPPKIAPLPYHPIFGVKLAAALGIFFIASVLVGRGPGMAAIRQNRRRWLTVVVLLAGLIVLLSGILSQIRQQQEGARPSGVTSSSES